MSAFSLCVPALVNLVLHSMGLAIDIYNKRKFINIVFSAIFIGLWTMLINNQCKAGRTWLAWTLMLLPYILVTLLLTAMIVIVVDKRENENKEAFEVSPLHLYNMDKWYNLNTYKGDVKYRFRNYPKIFCNVEKGCHCEPDKN